jgi:type I restriction enzyme S subunit
MSTWTKQKLGDICDVRDGTHDSPKPSITGFPLITSKHIINNKIDLSSAYLITDEDYHAVNKRSRVDKFDLLISMIGTVGEVALVKENPIFAIKNVGLIKTNDEALGKYLFYFLISPTGKNTLESLLTGSTQKFISLSKLRNFPVTLPPEVYRNKITSVLSAYDDLIENNERRIKALEEMAQLLYTEWFVKFKFPGHEKVKLIDSGTEYGKIPEWWEVKKLSEVASFVRGCSYSSEEIDDFVGDYYMVNLKSFNRGGGFRFDGAKYFSGTINNSQLLRAGDIVVAVTDMTNDRAVIARPARVPEIDGKVTLSADVVKMNSDILPNSFLYEILSSYRFTEKTKQKANGANVLHLKPAAILEFEALIPSAELLKEFAVLCEPAINEADKIVKQNDILAKTRDLLIPQLVTGKRELK